MNIPIKKIAFICAVAAAFASCKKKSSSPSVCRLASQTDSVAGTTQTFQWTNGKLTRDQSGTSTYIYTYYSGIVVVEEDTSGVLYMRDTMLLNSAGYVYRYTAGVYVLSYEYDADGHVTKETDSNTTSPYTAVITREWFGGNATQSTQTSGGSITMTTYEYYTDKLDWLGATTTIFGRGNKNLIKKATGTDGSTEYQYEYDSKGNATTTIEIQKDNAGNVTYKNRMTSTYQCD